MRVRLVLVSALVVGATAAATVGLSSVAAAAPASPFGPTVNAVGLAAGASLNSPGGPRMAGDPGEGRRPRTPPRTGVSPTTPTTTATRTTISGLRVVDAAARHPHGARLRHRDPAAEPLPRNVLYRLALVDLDTSKVISCNGFAALKSTQHVGVAVLLDHSDVDDCMGNPNSCDSINTTLWIDDVTATTTKPRPGADRHCDQDRHCSTPAGAHRHPHHHGRPDDHGHSDPAADRHGDRRSPAGQAAAVHAAARRGDRG